MSTKHMTSHQLDREPTDYTTWSHAALQARHRELRAQILRDFPMPATETDEDAHIERLLQEVKERTKSATPTDDDAPAVDGNELLQELTQFIARYLQCSQHQRTLLALWVLHTYCFGAARVTPYLAIRSADKQSGVPDARAGFARGGVEAGKTLCLQLLSLLCDHAALTSGGFTARDLALPMKEKTIAALLFDECQLTIGTRTHPRSPALRAVLAGSFHLGLGHRNIAEERNAFLPKAFAGSGPLPEELAHRCIPIILEPLDTRVAQPSKPQQKNKSGPQPPSAASFALNPFENPSERERAPSILSSPSISSTLSTEIPERFDLHYVADQIKPLRDRLERWTKNHFSLLTNRALLPRSAFPPNLSPRQQDLCDPLLQIAALVGGPWIARALQACAIVFDLQSIFELRPNLQLLADVRDCFAHHNWPDRLPTEALLDWTDSVPPRPWNLDAPLNPRTIAHLLRPFDIRPRNQRIGKADPKRGYELKDFQQPWKKYLSTQDSLIANCQLPTAAIPEIANKDAACNTISHAHAVSLSTEARLAQGAKPLAQGTHAIHHPIAKPAASSQQLAAQPKNKRRKVATPDPTAEPILTERQKAGTATQQPSATTQSSLTANCQPPIAQIAPAQQPRPNEILPGITCGDVFDDRWLHAFRR